MKTKNQSVTENMEQWHLLVETANSFFSDGLYEKAETTLQEALNLPDLLNCNDFKTATVLNNLGLVHYAQKSYQKAEEYYQKAYDIWQNNFDQEHLPFAMLLNNMAVLYYAKNQFDKAETVCSKALDIKQKLAGKNNLDFAELLNFLALIYYAKGDVDKSEELFEQVLDIRKKYLGKNHSLIQSVNDNLCEIKNLKQDSFSIEPDMHDRDSSTETVETDEQTKNKTKKTAATKINKETKSSKKEERPAVKRGRPSQRGSSVEKRRWKKEK